MKLTPIAVNGTLPSWALPKREVTIVELVGEGKFRDEFIGYDNDSVKVAVSLTKKNSPGSALPKTVLVSIADIEEV